MLVQHCNLNNSYDKCFKQISVVFDNELDILLSISKFGRINLNEISPESNLYKIEDYQLQNKDHIDSHKNLINEQRDVASSEKISVGREGSAASESSEKKPSVSENVPRVAVLECVRKQDARLCQHEHKKQRLSACCSGSARCGSHSIRKYCDTINRLATNAGQPTQVQLWMDQIICEPETEPQPSNVMEHSQIKP